jgi:hypothetical protein
MPAAVFGPVLSPPWSLHRPFFITGHWQRVPRLVFAPQRAAFKKSPDGLPFLSIPRRLSWGVPPISSTLPLPATIAPQLRRSMLPARVLVCKVAVFDRPTDGTRGCF